MTNFYELPPHLSEEELKAELFCRWELDDYLDDFYDLDSDDSEQVFLDSLYSMDYLNKYEERFLRFLASGGIDYEF